MEMQDSVETNKTVTEWVAVLHGDNGTIKMAFRNTASLARGLRDQTSEGWVVASVYERQRQTYSAED